MKKIIFRKYKNSNGQGEFIKLLAALVLVFILIFGQGVFSLLAEVTDTKYMEMFLASVLPVEVSDRLSLQKVVFGFELQNPMTILENGLYTANAEPEDTPSPTAAATPSPTAEQSVKEATVTSNGNAVTNEGIAVQNHTTYNPDLDALINEKLKFTVNNNSPTVLIVHTHASEAYTPTEENNYIPSDPDRTEDINFNVVRVGKQLAKAMTDNGINVIHDTTIHDYPSYNGSYSNCRKTVENYLAQYPSIKIVLDVHRDAASTEKGEKVKLVTEIGGKKTAQVMIVTGTDACGLSHPNWRENLKFAMKLQRRVNLYYPNLMRPVDLREERFNTNTTLASVILEMGSNGNTLEEALNAADCVGFALADMMQYIEE